MVKSQSLPMIFDDFWSMEIDLLVPKNDQPSTCYPPRGPMRFRRTRSALRAFGFGACTKTNLEGTRRGRSSCSGGETNEDPKPIQSIKSYIIIYNIIISIQNHCNLLCIGNIGIYQHHKSQTKTVSYGIKREKALSKPGSSAKSLCDSFFRFRRW